MQQTRILGQRPCLRRMALFAHVDPRPEADLAPERRLRFCMFMANLIRPIALSFCSMRCFILLLQRSLLGRIGQNGNLVRLFSLLLCFLFRVLASALANRGVGGVFG